MTAPSDIVTVSIEDTIATVTLNREDRHNAFNAEIIRTLSDTWDMLAANSDIRAVILRGAGKSFSAGADMDWMRKAGDLSLDENKQDALYLAQMLNKLYTLPAVTIGAVQGAALGGGMGLACCCDIIVAGPDAKFALSEVKIGLIPATIGPYVMASLGPRHSRRYFQTGERFGADKAYDIGLAHEKADSLDHMEEIIAKIVSHIKANGPQAMKDAKKLAGDLAGKDVNNDLLEDTAERIAAIRSTDEAKEGLSAFLEKRKANWA
jgi:methylglutaconyl-CoA hydratase